MSPEMDVYLTAMRTYEAARKVANIGRTKPMEPSLDDLGAIVEKAFDDLLRAKGAIT